MPERFEIYIVYKMALCKYSPFPFLSYITRQEVDAGNEPSMSTRSSESADVASRIAYGT